MEMRQRAKRRKFGKGGNGESQRRERYREDGRGRRRRAGGREERLDGICEKERDETGGRRNGGGRRKAMRVTRRKESDGQGAAAQRDRSAREKGAQGNRRLALRVVTLRGKIMEQASAEVIS